MDAGQRAHLRHVAPGFLAAWSVESGVTRYCRYCRSRKPEEEFVEERLCRACGVSGRGRRSVAVNLRGWRMSEPRLPEMRVPTEGEVGTYRGELWLATKGDWKLEVLWRGDHGKFLCRAVRVDDPDNPAASRTFDYPHEVVDWIGVWTTQLAKAR